MTCDNEGVNCEDKHCNQSDEGHECVDCTSNNHCKVSEECKNNKCECDDEHYGENCEQQKCFDEECPQGERCTEETGMVSENEYKQFKY